MSEQMYGGVDLHSTNGVYSIVRGDGTAVWQRRLPNCAQRVVASLEPFRRQLVCVAIESTYNWYWLADALQDAGYTVKLAHAPAMEQYNGLKKTDDDSDAAFVAELLRLGILPTGWICPREDRRLRDALRRRLLAVRARTKFLLSLQSMVVREKAHRLRCAELRTLPPDGLDGLLKDDTLSAVAHSQLELIHAHDAAIGSLEELASEQCRRRPACRLLVTVPGIGKILSMTIMLEIGDIRRFPGPGNLSSICRAVPAVRTSNRKGKGRNNSRNGNVYLAWAFIEVANHAIRCCEPARRWYQRKTAKTLPVVARKALASKLSKAVWYMLTEEKPFDIKKVFG